MPLWRNSPVRISQGNYFKIRWRVELIGIFLLIFPSLWLYRWVPITRRIVSNWSDKLIIKCYFWNSCFPSGFLDCKWSNNRTSKANFYSLNIYFNRMIHFEDDAVERMPGSGSLRAYVNQIMVLGIIENALRHRPISLCVIETGPFIFFCFLFFMEGRGMVTTGHLHRSRSPGRSHSWLRKDDRLRFSVSTPISYLCPISSERSCFFFSLNLYYHYYSSLYI